MRALLRPGILLVLIAVAAAVLLAAILMPEPGPATATGPGNSIVAVDTEGVGASGDVPSTPLARVPSAYWIDCTAVVRCAVLHPSLMCTNRQLGLYTWQHDCVASTAGWVMTCNGDSRGGGSYDCVHSLDGAFTCGGSGLCIGPVWSQFCSRDFPAIDCQRWDSKGKEELSCQTNAKNDPTWTCKWVGVMDFACETTELGGNTAHHKCVVGVIQSTVTATPTATSTNTPSNTPTPTATATASPTAMPLDSDGDGCTDAQENGADPTRGGMRDPEDHWDFFDPTMDGSVSILDFFALLERFGSVGDPTIDPLSGPPPAPAYHTRFDRGGQIGANGWNVAPPDGAIAITDFFALLAQFGHTCAS